MPTSSDQQQHQRYILVAIIALIIFAVYMICVSPCRKEGLVLQRVSRKPADDLSKGFNANVLSKVKIPTRIANMNQDYVAFAGQLLPDTKIRIVIGLNQFNKILTYDMDSENVYAANISGKSYEDIMKQVTPYQIWQYNPHTGSICPDKDSGRCLSQQRIGSRKTNSVTIEKWVAGLVTLTRDGLSI